MRGSSCYATFPGYENFSLNLPGKVTIKAGICMWRRDPQRYLNNRYGQSPVLYYAHMSHVDIEQMKEIETRILWELQHIYNYEKQHGKKEHFIIPDNKEETIKFVNLVRTLYTRYCK